MATKATVTVSIADVYAAVTKCFRAALVSGRNWHAVTVGADGVPYVREEVSPCYSESEYFGTGDPYPVTVWHTKGMNSDDAGDFPGDIDGEVMAFDPAEQFDGYGGEAELIRKLEVAGFTVVD